MLTTQGRAARRDDRQTRIRLRQAPFFGAQHDKKRRKNFVDAFDY
jgi:hypothetical protein